jgi:hypothetical protein
VSTRLGQLLESLPLTQRLLRYRQLSQEALQKATNIQDEATRAGYLSMAAGWHTLATEIERLREHHAPEDERHLPAEETSPDSENSQDRPDQPST